MNPVFWLLAATLVLLAAGFVVWPLLRTGTPVDTADDAESRRAQNLEAYRIERIELDEALAAGSLTDAAHRDALLEIDRRLLQDAVPASAGVTGRAGGRRTLLVLALVLPMVALLGYQHLGAGSAERLDALLTRLDKAGDDETSAALIAEALPLLEREARGRDEDGAWRFLLARVYSGQQRYPEAAASYAEVAGLYPQDAAILAQYAQTLYLAAGRKITPAVQELIDRTLAIDPGQVTLLGLLGMDRFQSGNYAGAVEAWEKLLANLPPDAPDASVIREGVAAARARLAADGGSVPALTGADQPAANAGQGPRLEVQVELASGLNASPDTTVFVFAKAVSGPPMPLAVSRFPVSELPKTVVLDDSMAMAPGMRLSGFPEVRVVARVSRGGGATAQSGDFEGDAGPVPTGGGTRQVKVRIDRAL